LDLLCQRRRETTSNLAEELGVSERTIRRDVEMLTLRYPIETVCGRYGGGVRMADWYKQDRRRLTPRQTALLRRLAAGLQGEDLEDMKQILTQFAS
jgi:predicted DNA-binding transcriptional regulator YafY